jgi:Peptidase propeptide and YPEB domain
MKSLLIAAICLACVGCDLDDWPGPDWMSRSEVVKTLEAAGYTDVGYLEADDGHWEGKGMKNGRLVKFHVDPHSGAIYKEKAEDRHLDIDD